MKRTIALLSFASFTVAAAAQQRVALREGLIIHPTQSVAYVMSPRGGVSEVDLTTGTTRWTSMAAAKPLALSGNLLVSQVEPRTQAEMRRLELVALDVQERGSPRARNSIELPQGVRSTIGETLLGTMISTAVPDAGGVVVTWQYLPQEIKGQDETGEPGGPPGSGLTPSGLREAAAPLSGAVRMNLTTGAMARVAAPRSMVPAASSTWRVRSTERSADGKSGVQYESADGRHILHSERVADDRTWLKYRWTVTERDTGRRVGETRSHVSFAPFVVRGSMLVFETTPYARGNDAQPAKLRGVDLQSGREQWSTEVREVVYRGPMPP